MTRFSKLYMVFIGLTFDNKFKCEFSEGCEVKHCYVFLFIYFPFPNEQA